MNIVPAEGNSPVSLLFDHINEAKCFPMLFPLGDKTLHDSQSYHLTLSRYFNDRIMHANGHFAWNVEYIFFPQYMSEIEQVVLSVSVVFRGGQKSQRISTSMLRDEESLKSFVRVLCFSPLFSPRFPFLLWVCLFSFPLSVLFFVSGAGRSLEVSLH